MRQVFNKLVRDNIPAVIEANGEIAVTRRLSPAQYERALFEKLGEECDEASQPDAKLAEEFADLLEVIHAICEHRGISFEEVERTRLEKRERRGGFEGRLFLIETSNQHNT